MKKLKVIVDRRRWLRGDINSFLLRYDGKMCCLGFACRARGFTKDEMLGKAEPRLLKRAARLFGSLTEKVPDCPDLPNLTPIGCTDICQQLMGINDSLSYSEEQREQKIKDLGEKVGFNFIFRN